MPVYTHAAGIADLSSLNWQLDGDDLSWTGTERARSAEPNKNGRASNGESRNAGGGLPKILAEKSDSGEQPRIAFEPFASDDQLYQRSHLKGLVGLLAAVFAAGVAAHSFMPSSNMPLERADLETVAAARDAPLNNGVASVVDEDAVPPPAATGAPESEAPTSPPQAAETQPSWQPDVHAEKAAEPVASQAELTAPVPAPSAPTVAPPQQIAAASAQPASERPDVAAPASARVARDEAKPAEGVIAPKAPASNASTRRATADTAGQRTPRDNTGDGRRQLLLGEKLFARGDLDGARKQFEEAALLGLPEGALALGNTFDPASLAKVGISSAGDAVRARRWYREAFMLALRPDRVGTSGQARAASAASDNLGESGDGRGTQ